MYDELYHFGVKGMKWGVRRYEDKSGHLTPAGKKRYDDYDSKSSKKTSTTVKNHDSQSKASKRVSDKSADNFVDRHRTGLRVTKAILGTVLRDSLTTSVSAKMIMSGKEEAGKALGTIGGLYSTGKLIGDLYIIRQDVKDARRN